MRIAISVLSPLFFAGLAMLVGSCAVAEGVNALANVGTGHFERVERQKALERVARDWCLTIRASQVLPVYPLDEDIQPGDVYIVNTPISRLKHHWKQKGYLPIEHRFARLQPTGYSAYYLGGYGISDSTIPPRHWQFPNGASVASETLNLNQFRNLPPEEAVKKVQGALEGNQKARDAAFAATNWPLAPRAGFPSYSFNMRRGESFQGAIPIQGVPVMLGALGARKIKGSVSLTDAYTYGIDEISLRNDLQSWSVHPEVRNTLTAYSSAVNKQTGEFTRTNYIRVITRVYLVRSVAVSMTNLEASGWKVSAGAPKDNAGNNLELGKESDTDSLLTKIESSLPSQSLDTFPAEAAGESSEKNLESLSTENQLLKEMLFNERIRNQLKRKGMQDSFGGYVLPGGTLQLLSSTERSISMVETFSRPLVVGVHALDFAISPNGVVNIDHPVSTFSILEGSQPPRAELVPVDNDDPNLPTVLSYVESDSGIQLVRNWIRSNGVLAEDGQHVDAIIFAVDPQYAGLRRQFLLEQ